MGNDRANMRSTRAFWDSNPCGIHDEFEAQKAQRYAMEPWLPKQIEKVASSHRSILEVGCEQGVDSIMFCAAMKDGSRYIGIDYSEGSVGVARKNAASKASELRVMPE